MLRPIRLALLIGIMAVAGCRTPQQTVVVTERPSRAPTIQDVEPVVRDSATVSEPTVEFDQFDFGKMWTFDNPPLEYFADAYGFSPDSSWFDHARLGALRFAEYCSASFVSPNGLILTNNHCARESVEKVSRSGEDLLENGFLAASLDQERVVPDLHVDQLISIEDVTPRIAQGLDRIQDVQRRSQVRESRIEQVEAELTASAQAQDSSLVVEIVSLYQGAQYKAYTFHRYSDIRLVMSTEHQIGYFGGDPDNFTYPRYNLDYSFLRAYDASGAPVQSPNYFRWSTTGASEGDVVFVVGSPGSTSRLKTVSQLRYERDYELPVLLEVLAERAAIFERHIEADPETAEETGMRSSYLSITNQIKSQTGELRGLRDPDLIGRREAAEQELRRTIHQVDSLRTLYRGTLDEIADLQQARVSMAHRAAAFTAFGSMLDSQILTRALYGYIHSLMTQRGFPPEDTEEIRQSARETEFYPDALEVDLLAARLRDLKYHLGPNDPTVRRILGNADPGQLASQLVDSTALNDSLRYESLMDDGFLGSDDVMVEIINAVGPAYLALAGQVATLGAREDALTARLAQARFAVYGTGIPPDASFSLRIADGVIEGYPYNGTIAPAFTTIAGLYDRYYSFTDYEDWRIPQRWIDRRRDVDLSAPINFVSTNDITGGNSGSPVLNRNLELVGLVFDSNIDALPNEYIYLDVTQRAVSVDVRGIMESLDSIYDASSLIHELLTGRLTD